jgi:hypothetical protein
MSKVAWVFVVALAVSPSACGDGGSESTPPAPTATPNPATTITIMPTGVVPKQLSVPLGSQVTFVNNDSRSHDMHSDPHPEHTDCPEFDQVGFLRPGQSRRTGNLNIARVCDFHDHDDADDVRWQGKVTIQ